MRYLYSLALSLVLVTGFTSNSPAADLTAAFEQVYKTDPSLTPQEQQRMKAYDFYLVPGILSEIFISEDERTRFDFSVLTGSYFQTQEILLNQKYGFSAKRLSSSSRSFKEIQSNIRESLQASKNRGRKAIFITHSLGGLALLQELVMNETSQKSVAGILFLQSPFKGSPIANLYQDKTYRADLWLRPLLPFFNTTDETLDYLSTTTRIHFMIDHRQAIQKLISRVPVITLSGIGNGHKSLFKPAIDIMLKGCIQNIFSKCMSEKLFKGPYDRSDGMVPFESSKLLTADYVILEGADHGETVVSIPFETYDKEATTSSLLKLLLVKLR